MIQIFTAIIYVIQVTMSIVVYSEMAKINACEIQLYHK